jgi:hypothetical protein
MRIVVAVLIFAALASVGLAMMRSLVGRTPHKPMDAPVAPPPDVRVVFWCENCGTELLLVRRGSEAAPRHCGESMNTREEVGRAER